MKSSLRIDVNIQVNVAATAKWVAVLILGLFI